MLRKFVIAASIILSASASYANDQVSLLLEWKAGGGHTGLFLAQKRGYFSEQGIDIEITPGGGSAKTVSVVATGGATFGLADGTGVVNAVSQGMPLKFIGVVNNLSPFAVCIREDRGVSALKDIEGKTVAFTAGTSYAIFFPALLRSHNIDISKVKMVNMDGATALASVVDGRVDGQLGGIDDQALVPQDKGVPMTILPARTLGLNAIGRGIIASNSTIDKNPDLVRRFLIAVKKGYDDAMKDPAAGTQAVWDAQDAATKDPLPQLTRQARINLTELMSSTVNGGASLALDPDTLTKQIEMMKQFAGLKTDKVAGDFYTDAFVPH